jgi:hypothetical protein
MGNSRLSAPGSRWPKDSPYGTPRSWLNRAPGHSLRMGQVSEPVRASEPARASERALA